MLRSLQSCETLIATPLHCFLWVGARRHAGEWATREVKGYISCEMLGGVLTPLLRYSAFHNDDTGVTDNSIPNELQGRDHGYLGKCV